MTNLRAVALTEQVWRWFHVTWDELKDVSPARPTDNFSKSYFSIVDSNASEILVSAYHTERYHGLEDENNFYLHENPTFYFFKLPFVYLTLLLDLW